MPTEKKRRFLFRCSITGKARSGPTDYPDVDEIAQSVEEQEPSEIIFAVVYPSRDWLNFLVDDVSVEHRFLHSHLVILPSGQRN